MKRLALVVLLTLISVFSMLTSFAQIGRGNSELEQRVAITATARSVEGAPYKFNGTTPDGFDSTGFIVYVYYKNKISLPQKLDELFRLGENVAPKDAKPGDILFFANVDDPERKYVGHAGVYLGKGAFIHMPAENAIIRVDHIKKGNKWAKLFIAARTYSGLFPIKSSAEEEMPAESDAPVNSGGYEESEYTQ